MRAACVFAVAAFLGLGACSEQTPARDDVSAGANCSHRADCIQIAFAGFQGQQAELFLNGQSVFRGALQTPDWTNEVSGSSEFMAADLTHVRLTLDGRTVVDRPVTETHVRTIYVEPRAPYVRLTDHPGPLLD